jgi:hypothetical protein
MRGVAPDQLRHIGACAPPAIEAAPRVPDRLKNLLRSPFGRLAIVSTHKLALPYCAVTNHAGAVNVDRGKM